MERRYEFDLAAGNPVTAGACGLLRIARKIFGQDREPQYVAGRAIARIPVAYSSATG
ncbi:MAG: hypothetical protein U0Q16_29080 [Bryobacteraceae bacterium]